MLAAHAGAAAAEADEGDALASLELVGEQRRRRPRIGHRPIEAHDRRVVSAAVVAVAVPQRMHEQPRTVPHLSAARAVKVMVDGRSWASEMKGRRPSERQVLSDTTMAPARWPAVARARAVGMPARTRRRDKVIEAAESARTGRRRRDLRHASDVWSFEPWNEDEEAALCGAEVPP